MISFSRGGDDQVRLAGAVVRGIIDLVLDAPNLDADVVEMLEQVREFGGPSLADIAPDFRTRYVSALRCGCEAAIAGRRSSRSGQDCASGNRLISGAEMLRDFLALEI